jgi:hypothetical protein
VYRRSDYKPIQVSSPGRNDPPRLPSIYLGDYNLSEVLKLNFGELSPADRDNNDYEYEEKPSFETSSLGGGQLRETRAAPVKPRRIQEDSDQDSEDYCAYSTATVDLKGSDSLSDFRVKTVAQKALFCNSFPKINADDDKTNDSNWRLCATKRTRNLMVMSIMTGAVFTTNLILTIIGTIQYTPQNGVGLIYEGDCSVVGSLDLWLHLLINILSTLMLMASNYCMQLQLSPTRQAVDRAHTNGTWLDIGVGSWRNFRYISRWRQISVAILLLSSAPIHLM